MKTITPGKSPKDNSKPIEKFSFWRMIIKHSTVSVLLLSVLALTVVYIWKESQNERQKSVILKAATLQLETNQQDLLKIMAKPLVWDIRSEMLRGNMEQVNLLITDLVKEKNFRYIHLIAANGNVILSTNKELEGKQIGNEIIAHLVLVESPSIVELADKIIVVAAPVMGIDRRLATLVIGYKTEEIKIKINK
jgi:Tfp pilus assembly protein PilZ